MFVSREEAIARAREDFNFFAALVLGDDYRFPFPPLYISLFERVKYACRTDRIFEDFAFGIPRGFAKTTWAKLVVTYLIIFHQKRFLGVACANEDLAKNLISDVWDYFCSPNIVELFGEVRADAKVDSALKKVFLFQGRWVAIAGVGARGTPRGWNIRNARPDILLMDDIQTRDDALSDIETKRLLDWMHGTFLYTRSPFGCTSIFLGNMYPGKNSILQMLHDDPNWTSVVVGGLLSNGESLWEDLYPKETLLDFYRKAVASGREHNFRSEILNDNSVQPIVEVNASDFYYVPPIDPLLAARFIILDPATNKAKSNNTAIAVFEVIDNIPQLIHIHEQVLDPKATIRKALELAMQYNVPWIAVEDVNYQSTLIFWFEETMQEAGIEGIEIIPINPKGISKNARIATFIKDLKAHNIGIHKNCASRVLEQIKNWNPHKRENVDDILDTCAYAIPFWTEHGQNYPVTIDIGLEPVPQLAPLSKVCPI